MAQSMATAPARPNAEGDRGDLPALLGRLGDQVADLVDTKISLLKVEIKEEAGTYLHSGVMMAAGSVLAAMGFGLVNVAAALGLSLLFSSYGVITGTPAYVAGFVTTGLFYLIIGIIVTMAVKSRLKQHDPAPTRSIEELRKDKQWLTKEL